MSLISEFANIWSTVKEIDLRPIRIEAEMGVQVAIAGRVGAGRSQLAEKMRHDLWRQEVSTLSPVQIIELKDAGMASDMTGDLVILLAPASVEDLDMERKLQRQWLDAGKKVLAVINTHLEQLEVGSESARANGKSGDASPVSQSLVASYGSSYWLVGDINDPYFLRDQFIPAVIGMLPDKLLALGRDFPLFRVVIGRQLINETCFTNATYAFSTGLAEIVPVLDIPLNVTDMFVLSKNQAFMVYRLGLTLGFSTRWQDYWSEFGGVLGGGFLWRQVARQLVGLIPAWGIVPKVAVSYAGTYVVGQAILQWYITGRHVSRQQLAEFYRQAFERGKQVAANLFKQKPRIKQEKRPALGAGKQKRNVCLTCGKKYSRQAQFCQYCGTPLRSGENVPATEAEED
jgi:uncharacterized protein (DUF697 family)